MTKTTAEDVLSRVGNVTPLEAEFIAALENGEIDGDVIALDDDNPPTAEE